MRGGLRFHLNTKELAKRRVIKQGCWEPKHLVYFFNGAREAGAKIFIDVGANFGYYSMIAAKLNIFQEIHAVEPHPESCEEIKLHIKMNDFQNRIKIHNIAATNKKEKMYMPAHSSGTNQVFSKNKNGLIKINGVPLDSLFNFQKQCIALKIDVEGHEMAALEGMERLLAGNKVFMQLEIFGGHEDIIFYLANRGFKLIYRIGEEFYFCN